MARKCFAETGSADFASAFEGRALKPVPELWDILHNKTFVCYGAGNGCRKFLSLMEEKSLLQHFHAVFDSSPTLQGKYLNGQLISEFDVDTANRVDMVVITPMFYSASGNIQNYLLDQGIREDKILLFSDYFAHNDIDLYFDKEILGWLQKDEIFVDGGCLDFTTSVLFLGHCPDTKKIYAFEPDKEQIDIIERNIKSIGYDRVRIINGALWSVNTELNFAVCGDKSGNHVTQDPMANEKANAYALDSAVDYGDRITFIKMDIEGAELHALKGARTIIQRDKPKLAVSLYHKPMDYIDIPTYIKSLVPEYQMFLRHYTTFDTETVLYCYKIGH